MAHRKEREERLRQLARARTDMDPVQLDRIEAAIAALSDSDLQSYIRINENHAREVARTPKYVWLGA